MHNQHLFILLSALSLFLAACTAEIQTPANDAIESQATVWSVLGTTLDTVETNKAYFPAMAVDPAGHPVVVWAEGNTFNYKSIFVKRWNGNAWESLGGSLNNMPTVDATQPALALDSAGNPIVAWQEEYKIFVKRWNGSSWDFLGSALNFNMFYGASFPAIAIDKNDNPIVTWQEHNGQTDNIWVKRWNGTNWDFLGGQLNSSRAGDSVIVIDSSNNPIVGFSSAGTIIVKHWNGENWVQLGNGLYAVTQQAGRSSMSINSSDHIIVAWDERDSSNSANLNVYAARWNGNTWEQLGGKLDINQNNEAAYPSVVVNSQGKIIVGWQERRTQLDIHLKQWSGSEWILLNHSPLNINSSNHALIPSLALSPKNQIFVAWYEGDTNLTNPNVYVKTRITSTWIPIGGVIDINQTQNTANASISVGINGRPVIAWREYSSLGGYDVYVKRWNGQDWTLLGGALDIELNRYADFPSIATDSLNRPVVAWQEYNNSHNLHVKRWENNAWVQLGTILDINPEQSTFGVSIKIDSLNRPVVAWAEATPENGRVVYVKRWNGSIWEQIGGQIYSQSKWAIYPSLALDTNDRPIVTWYENYGVWDVYVKRWDGANWIQLGGMLDSSPGIEAALPMVSTHSKDIFVVWREKQNSTYKLIIKKWDESRNDWLQLGVLSTMIPTNGVGNRPAITIRSDGNPVVAWQEYNPSNNTPYGIFAKRWNGNRWISLGSHVNTIPTQNAVSAPAITINTNNSIFIGWSEGVTSNGNMYVKRY